MKPTPTEWFFDKIKSHFTHDGDLLESLTFTLAIAKQKERDQLVNFLLFLNDEKLINNHDFDYEKMVKKYLNK